MILHLPEGRPWWSAREFGEKAVSEHDPPYRHHMRASATSRSGKKIGEIKSDRRSLGVVRRFEWSDRFQ